MKIDHIHAHFVAWNGIAAQIASDLTGIPFSLHAHAYDIFQRNQECVRRQLELSNGIVTVSEYHRQYIANLCLRWHPEDIQVVHYGLDANDFMPEHMPDADHVVRIISVGSLVEKKGHEYLIDACAQLAAMKCNFRCTIVGSGPLRISLQARIDKYQLQDKIALVGAKDQTEIKNLYRCSDIFVLACVIAKSGDRDGMPNVLLEAMAMQLPVITTPVTGNTELVQDEENGLLVPERNSDRLAQAVLRLISDKPLRCKLGQQGRQTVLAGYEIHRTAGQMADFFRFYGRKR